METFFLKRNNKHLFLSGLSNQRVYDIFIKMSPENYLVVCDAYVKNEAEISSIMQDYRENEEKRLMAIYFWKICYGLSLRLNILFYIYGPATLHCF